MLDLFAYPVSAVMKLWHLLLHNVLGLSQDTAWVLALFGLVVTIRSFIAPLFWIQFKSGRISMLMRPEHKALEERDKHATTPEELAAVADAKKELKERYNHKPLAGCLTVFVQFPAFLGLYRVVLSMARPEEGFGADYHPPIGVLDHADITSFLSSTFADIPLAAYRRMPDSDLAALGTNTADVTALTQVLLLLVILATTFNMALSTWRNRQSLDWDSRVGRGLFYFLVAMSIATPFMLASAGWNGPVPIAVLLYWFANNLWTFGQTAVLHLLLNIRYPLSDEYRAHSAQRRAAFKDSVRERRAHKWWVRRRRLASFKASNREALARDKAERATAKREEKAAAAQRKKARAQAQAQLREQQKNQME